MNQTLAHSEKVSKHPAFRIQRISLAACIILAPLSITLYLLAVPGNGRHPLVAVTMAGSTRNTLHLIGAVAASFFLPLG